MKCKTNENIKPLNGFDFSNKILIASRYKGGTKITSNTGLPLLIMVASIIMIFVALFGVKGETSAKILGAGIMAIGLLIGSALLCVIIRNNKNLIKTDGYGSKAVCCDANNFYIITDVVVAIDKNDIKNVAYRTQGNANNFQNANGSLIIETNSKKYVLEQIKNVENAKNIITLHINDKETKITNPNLKVSESSDQDIIDASNDSTIRILIDPFAPDYQEKSAELEKVTKEFLDNVKLPKGFTEFLNEYAKDLHGLDEGELWLGEVTPSEELIDYNMELICFRDDYFTQFRKVVFFALDQSFGHGYYFLDYSLSDTDPMVKFIDDEKPLGKEIDLIANSFKEFCEKFSINIEN